MGIFNIFRKKDITQHRWDDEDRKLSADIRAANAEMKRKKQELEIQKQELLYEKERLKTQLEMEKIKAELEELTGDYEGPEETGNNPDTMLQTLLMSVLMKNNNPTPMASASTNHPVQDNSNQPKPLSLSDEQLKEMWEKDVPAKYKALSKTVSDTTLKVYIDQNLPGYDEDTRARALKIARQN